MAEEVAVEKVENETTANEMSPARRGPLSALPRFEQEFERFFTDHHWPFRRSDWPFSRSDLGVRVPNVDVVDREEEIVVRAELPGVEKEQIDISLGSNSVTIKTKSESESKEEDGDYHRHEISRAYDSRTVRLPSEVIADGAKARLTAGVLEVTLPKAAKSERRSIEIES